MSDDMVLQLSSNSSNQSDQSLSLPSKIAKLEARMAGKTPSSQLAAWPSLSATADDLPSTDSDDDDHDNGTEYLIQANTQKRQKLDDDFGSSTFEYVEAVVDRDPNQSLDVNKRRQGRGRGNTVSGRGRSSRANGQIKTQNSQMTNSSANPYLENSLKGVIELSRSSNSQNNCSNDPHGIDGRFALEEQNKVLLAKVAELEESLKSSRKEASNHKQLYHETEKELKEVKDYELQMKPKRTKIISDLLISVSKAERQEARLKVRQDSLRLGNVGVIRAGTIISETWEDGQALKDLNTHLKDLLEMKESIERQRKSLKKRQSDRGDAADAENGSQEEDIQYMDEVFKSRLASIKRDEETTMRERERYEIEKGRLIREMKRIRDEDGSRFNNFRILNHRYALLNLLGKGGFSEVYKAFDLVDHRYVACKIHGLNAQWNEEKKQSYMRHAIREYQIHKTLMHRHIVRLWDIFEIDQNTFCTILEYCSGKDLDAVLKATPVLLEKEAKIIIVQIFLGLVYLNKRTQKIIHYDLKPGNVLFDECGVAKVTDFGLSKIVEDNGGSQGMELTSQGAGTYWYLPPECFDQSRTPMISSKVDVWSAGILLYQMLFGRRPFGHNQTQERILREDTIIKARKVEFPSKPAVSNEAKDFIRRCLTYNQADRPDVLTIAQDPFLTYTKK